MSGRQKGASSNVEGNRKPEDKASGDKRGRKQKTGDVGRALRSIYDETLREAVPDDFMDLLGKLR